MQKRLNELSFVRKLNALDGSSRVLNKLVIANPFSFLPGDTLRIAVFINRPHGIGVENGSDEIVFPRFHQMTVSFRFTPQGFTPLGDPGELPWNVGELLDPARYLLKITLHARSAIAENFSGASLIPIYAAGLDYLIQNPPLFPPAFHFPLCFDSHGRTLPPLSGERSIRDRRRASLTC